MAKFVVYTNAAGHPVALNVDFVEKFVVGDLALSPTERYSCLMAVHPDGTHLIARGEPQMLQEALCDLVSILTKGGSVLIYPDGHVTGLGE